jgi:hypothetical protein
MAIFIHHDNKMPIPLAVFSATMGCQVIFVASDIRTKGFALIHLIACCLRNVYVN